jgi:hypothetical protein
MRCDLIVQEIDGVSHGSFSSMGTLLHDLMATMKLYVLIHVSNFFRKSEEEE